MELPKLKQKYDAISLDTSIIEKLGYRFSSGYLKRLETFQNSHIMVVISEVVDFEIRAHLRTMFSEMKQKFLNVSNDASNYFGVSKDELAQACEILRLNDSPEALANSLVNEFITRTGAKILPATYRIDGSQLLAYYFHGRPPFSSNGKKKQEFPDAIALFSLEDWAIRERKKVLAVSSDSDWERFGLSSKHITVVGDLGEGLALFERDEKGNRYSKYLLKELEETNCSTILKYINKKVEGLVNKSHFKLVCDNDHEIEILGGRVSFESLKLKLKRNGINQILPWHCSEEKLVVRIPGEVSVSGYCRYYWEEDEFYWSRVGNAVRKFSTTDSFDVDILVGFALKDGSEKKIVRPIECEVLGLPKNYDFGIIDTLTDLDDTEGWDDEDSL